MSKPSEAELARRRFLARMRETGEDDGHLTPEQRALLVAALRAKEAEEQARAEGAPKLSEAEAARRRHVARNRAAGGGGQGIPATPTERADAAPQRVWREDATSEDLVPMERLDGTTGYWPAEK